MRIRRRRFQAPKVRLEAGSYKIRFYDLAGKRRTKALGRAGGITLAEAKRLASDFLRPINDQKEYTRHTGRTIRDAIEKWRKSIKPLLRPATARNYEAMFDKLTPLQDCPCNILNKADIQQWVTDLSSRYKGGTVRTYKAYLSGFLATVEDWEWIESNPAKARIRLPADDKAEPNVLTPGQVSLLARALDPEARTLLLVAALTGLRRGELAGLEWDDIDAEGIHVRRTSGPNGIGPPKSRKSRRLVRIGPMLRGLLVEWRAALPLNSRLVFPYPKGGAYGRLWVVMRWVIQPACIALKLPPIHWHSLRHTHNTWGRLAGIEAEVMRDQMGHSDVRITLQTYSHVRPTDDAAGRIEALLTVPENGTQESQVIQ